MSTGERGLFLPGNSRYVNGEECGEEEGKKKIGGREKLVVKICAAVHGVRKTRGGRVCGFNSVPFLM